MSAACPQIMFMVRNEKGYFSGMQSVFFPEDIPSKHVEKTLGNDVWCLFCTHKETSYFTKLLHRDNCLTYFCCMLLHSYHEDMIHKTCRFDTELEQSLKTEGWFCGSVLQHVSSIHSMSAFCFLRDFGCLRDQQSTKISV